MRNAEEQTRRAWAQYVDALEGLSGAEYERAEDDAWTQLQTTLEALRRSEAPPDSSSVG